MLKLTEKRVGEAIVSSVHAKKILVMPIAQTANDNGGKPQKKCGAGCGSCGGCASARGDYTRKFFINTNDAQKYACGNRIKFCKTVPEQNVTSALVFGVPLIFVFIAVIFWNIFAPQKIESPLAVTSVIAALVCGIFTLGIIDGIFKRKYPVTIIKEENEK